MQGDRMLSRSPCKRDALPAELTALSAENSTFPEVAERVNTGPNGTERKREGLHGQQSPEIVPKDDLYFIRSATAGTVKIGRAKNPRARMKEIQVGNHELLDLWAVLPARGDEERGWHALLQADRLRGEWFRDGPAMLWAVMHGRWGLKPDQVPAPSRAHRAERGCLTFRDRRRTLTSSQLLRTAFRPFGKFECENGGARV